MLVNRHHVRYLIDLGQVAEGKTASQLAPLKDRLDAFLGTLGGAASPAAVRAFEAQLQRLPKDDRPWSAVRRPNTIDRLADDAIGGPPAAVLLLDQEDDDPDGEEDGNRLPDPGTTTGVPWAALHEALRRWDTAEILRWAGPLGWQRPSESLDLTQEAELAISTPSRSTAETPATPAEAAARAAQEADDRSKRTLRAVGVAVAVGGGGALLFGLGRALGGPSKTPKSAPPGAKEVTP
jgi:hypothetical protein